MSERLAQVWSARIMSAPAAGSPARRPHSLRRTSHLDMTWPSGFGTDLHIDGAARDLVTGLDGDGRETRSARLHVVMDSDRTVKAIEVEPEEPLAPRLLGARAGRGFRRSVADSFRQAADEGHPAYLLLDDLAGASLIAGFAWSRRPSFAHKLRPPARGPMEGICSGYRSGSSALLRRAAGDPLSQNVAVAGPVVSPTDPLGWHTIGPPRGVCMRRRRRIDVWADGAIHVDAMFRDSTWSPSGEEIVVHEYGLAAVGDSNTGRLLSLQATPRVLPYEDCPLAANEITRLIGEPLAGLRTLVLDRLKGEDCCTHLNDMLRALAEVPVLYRDLPGGI